MGVAGDDLDQAVLQKIDGRLLRSLAEPARNALRGHLGDRALTDQPIQGFGRLGHGHVPLGVADDRDQSLEHHLGDELLHASGQVIGREFDENIIRPVDGQAEILDVPDHVDVEIDLGPGEQADPELSRLFAERLDPAS